MNVSNIGEYLWAGRNGVNWYGDCRKVLVDLFGEDKLNFVSKVLAATSINTSLKSNVRLFRKALYEIEHNLPVGRYLPNIRQQLAQVRAGGELTGPKINAFARAMAGDPDAVVVDIWISRAFGLCEMTGKFSPSKRQYLEVEAWCRETAPIFGLQPADFTACIWAGIRTKVSGDFETHYKTLLYFHYNTLF